jgi:hypothetical protein
VAKVFVVSETQKHNIIPAADFGEIEIVLPPNQAQVIFSSGPTVQRVKRALEDFCDDDYLLFIGDPTAISILAAVAAAKNSGRYKALKWDKQERRYLPIQIDLFPHRRDNDDD